MISKILIQKQKTVEEEKYHILWKNWDKSIAKYSKISSNDTPYNYKYVGMKDINRTIFPFYSMSEGDTIVSCGCARWYLNNGMSHPFIFSTLAKKIFLFEADLINIPIIKKYIEENNINNISLIPKAIYNKDGRVKFSSYKNTPGGSNHVGASKKETTVEVESTTLDAQFADRAIDYLHLTINGTEYQALEGATKLLKTNPTVTIAILNKDHKMFDIRKPAIEMLYDMGYYIGWARGCSRQFDNFWFAIATMDKDKLLSSGYSYANKLFPI